jgi:serine/threonine protein kinase
LLVVTLEPEPSFATSKMPAPARTALVDAVTKPPPVADVEATAAPPEQPGTPEFSVAASIVRSAPPPDDATYALERNPGPARRKAAVIDATEAEEEVAAPQGEEDDSLSGTLGGYRVEKELGRGGMGAVYLARQVSLDRPVALKVMNSRWASNPNFLVRFTREAYAAAQLVHHNVVQVYDIGDDRGVNFFSMEFVEGQSLGDLLRKDGPLPPESAAGYILQAARGLQFAHERGMIHRDIKPDNLMLNAQGVVKVADLGLVRTPGGEEAPRDDADRAANRAALDAQVVGSGRTLGSLSGVTLVGQAMGTPSYMSPEQARDATSVDHRADIYSLGCTLYVLLTGRPVFEATTALEMMTRHAADTPTRPEVHNKAVPRSLSDVVLRMIAKKPEDRYASMGEVAKVLEDFLGLHGGGEQMSAESHLRTLEQGVEAFRQVPVAKLRALLLLGTFGGCAAFFLLFVLFGFWKVGGFFLGLGLLSAVAYAVVRGGASRSPLFVRSRATALSLGWLDYAKLGLGVLLLLGVLFAVGLLWGWLLAALLAVGVALALHYAFDRRIAAQRAAALEKVERLLETLRRRGLSEDALQEFVARNTGDHWEEIFEALFGYEAKLAARPLYGRGPKGARPRFGAWRDPVVGWLDRSARARQEARERKHLQEVERKGLVAQGIDDAEAKQQAERVAAAMVEAAATIKKEEAAPLDATVLPSEAVDFSAPNAKSAPAKRVNMHDLMAVAAAPQAGPARSGPGLAPLLRLPFGSTTRFFVGAALVAACVLWMNKENLLPSSTINDEAAVLSRLWQTTHADSKAAPLTIPLVPAEVNVMLSSVNAGIAGVALLLSIFWRSWKIGFLVLFGAAVMVIGPVSGYALALGPMAAQVSCLAVGGGIAALGFMVGRDT